MKLIINKKELIEMDAWCCGLETFIKAHGDRDVTLSQALDSNGWNDIWWYINRVYSQLSQKQKDDLNLLGCDWAESVLHLFEIKYPNDKRPRLVIQASRDYINGLITYDELDVARSVAKSAARSVEDSEARSVAYLAVGSAARSVEHLATKSVAKPVAKSVAYLEVDSAAYLAIRKSQITDLKNLFLTWEI